jgi:iduronate 2-sulfatase
MWCKHSNYEQATRIPVIVSAPGKAQGVSTKALIESVDIYPTLCELAGIQTPNSLDGNSLDGKSFAKVLQNPNLGHRDHAISVYPRSKEGVGQVLGRSIRTERYRLVQWKAWNAPNDSAEYELYDYQTDPLETRNLASEQPAVVAKLLESLSSHPEAKPPVKPSGADGSSSRADSKQAEREELFNKKDRNSDGFLSDSEFMAGQKDPQQAKERFRKFDVDRDGKLNRKEFVTSGKTAG